MKSVTSMLVLTLSLAFPLGAAAQDTAGHRQQIDAVVTAFRLAIVNKDVPGFMRLFLREDITLVGVYTDGSVARYNASLTEPTQPRGVKTSGGTPRKFIESIARAPEPRTETFENVRIDTDGDVAQVWFDYRFMVGDYANNWGKESWQLVRTEAGWKISAVSWSAEENPVPRSRP